jgi:hypothetical protein
VGRSWAYEQVPGWPLAARSDFHVHPVGDLVEHELVADRCLCGPRPVPAVTCTGEQVVIYVHASLDGRELAEHGRQIRREA